MSEKEMTALCTPVGAGVRQPDQKICTTITITDCAAKINRFLMKGGG